MNDIAPPCGLPGQTCDPAPAPKPLPLPLCLAAWPAALSGLLLFGPMPLQAQTVGSPDAEAPSAAASASATLPQVRVQGRATSPGSLDTPSRTASRLDLTPLQTPASIEVLTGDVVRERADRSLPEATSRATGITMATAPGNGGTALAARGFAGNVSVMQLYDGTRLYLGAGTVTFPFDPWSVDRIEVLRGAASVMYGEGSIGAAVNIVPKKPQRAAIEHEARLALGSDDTRDIAYGSGGAIDERWSYRFDISHRRSDSFMERGESESLAVGAAARLDVSPRLHVTLSRDEGHNKPQRYFGVPLIDGRLDDRNKERNYNVEDAIVEFRDRWTRLDAQWTPNARLRLRNQLYHLDSRREWKNSEWYTWNPQTGQVDRDDYLHIGHDQEQVGNRFDLQLTHPVGGFENQLLLGFDLNHIRFRHGNDSPYGGFSSVDPYDFDPGVYLGPTAYTPRYRTRTDTWSVFLEDRLVLGRGWSVVAGLRRDDIAVERRDLVNPTSTTTNFDKDFAPTSGRIGVVWEPAPRQSVYAQFARAVDPLAGVITTSAAQQQFDLTTGRQVELGYKRLLDEGRGAWSLAAYYLEKRKLLSRGAEDPTVLQQVGQQSSRGIEATLELALTPTLRLDANLARLDARYDDYQEIVFGEDGTPGTVSRDGRTPAGVPEFSANLWLDWRFLPQWRGALGLRHVGPREANTANTAQVGSYTVADASLGWQLNRRLRLGAHLFNVFDRDYAVSTSNGGTQWLLGRPRAFEVSAEVRF